MSMNPVKREDLKPGLAVKLLAALEPNEMVSWHRGVIHSVTHIGSQEDFNTSCEVRVRRGEQSYGFTLHEEELRSILYVEGSPKSYLELQLDDAITRRDQWHAECVKTTELLNAERAAHAETKKDLENAEDNALAIRQVLDEVRKVLGSEEGARITSLASKWVERVKKLESELDCEHKRAEAADAKLALIEEANKRGNARMAQELAAALGHRTFDFSWHRDVKEVETLRKNAERAAALQEQNAKLTTEIAEANARSDRNFEAYRKEKAKVQEIESVVTRLKT